jgi:threonine dehydrogenase-like Zn-dependent dehydrogenase
MARGGDGLDGAVAIVTGAAGGIGSAVVALLRERGAAVVAEDIDPAVNELADDQIAPVQGDAATSDVARQAVATALERFGRLDVVVNNAGCSWPPGSRSAPRTSCSRRATSSVRPSQRPWGGRARATTGTGSSTARIAIAPARRTGPITWVRRCRRPAIDRCSSSRRAARGRCSTTGWPRGITTERLGIVPAGQSPHNV